MLAQFLTLAISAIVLGGLLRATVGGRVGVWLMKLGVFLVIKSLVLFYTVAWLSEQYTQGNWLVLGLGVLCAVLGTILLLIYAVMRVFVWSVRGVARAVGGQHRSTILGAVAGAVSGEVIRRAIENRRLP